MIFIALGANLPSRFGGPLESLEAALSAMEKHPDIKVARRSSWYKTSPVGKTDQPDFINGVVSVTTGLAPAALLQLLLGLEREFGRERRERWGARVLDLDIIDFDGKAGRFGDGDETLDLPHPRAHTRAFVLAPLEEIEPNWVHPVLGVNVGELLGKAPNDQIVEKIRL